MSPMCPLSQAYPPSPTQKVFFRSPPTASAAGPASAARPAAVRSRATGGPEADHRRRPAAPSRRTAPGSAGRGSARRRPAGRAAIASSSSVTMGSPARLPLVITSTCGPGRVAGQPEQQPCTACRAASPRGRASPGRRRGASRRSSCLGASGSSTTGRRGSVSSRLVGGSVTASPARRAGSATMIANGLSPRSLRLRSVLTAVCVPASQAR